MDKDMLDKEQEKLNKEKEELEKKIQKLKDEQTKMDYLSKEKRIYGRKISVSQSSAEDSDVNNDFSSYNSNFKNTGYKDATYEEVSSKRPTKQYSNKSNKLIPFIALIVLVSLLSGFVGAMLVNYLDDDDSSTSVTSTKSVNITETTSIADAVEKVYDAVVVVETYQNDELYSTGTGFVYKKDGNTYYIMTNNHVVDGGDSVKVLFNSGDELETKIVGADTYSDIAVLSIESKNDIQVATIGSTDELKVGDTVFTVGSPEGSEYAGTVTKGVISAKERLVEVALSSSTTSDYYMQVLQTDAAINPGNSGGPLCNASGEVIGITNMKLVDDSVEGMGFAIPIEDAIDYAKMLEENGKITRPYIGISMLDVSDSYYLWQSGIMIPSGVEEGVVVYSVESGSPAANASLQKGDVIIEISGTSISSVAEFRYELYKHSPGETIEIKYNRDGKEATTKVTLTENKS